MPKGGSTLDLFDRTTPHDRNPESVKFKGRDTGSGKVFENNVYSVLVQHGGYHILRQQCIGKRDGVKHLIDFVVTHQSRRILIEAKWQSRAGAGEKVVGYELMSLAERLAHKDYDAAYIVLGGPGWTKARKESWIRGEYRNHLSHSANLHVIDLDTFYQKAYEGRL